MSKPSQVIHDVKPYVDWITPQRCRTTIKVGERCFTVDKFLSHRECEYYINKCNKIGFVDLKDEYEPKYRNSKRLLVRSDKLARELYKRVKDFFVESDFDDIRPYGFYTFGTWKPVGLNNVFKISRYEQDTHFRPHFDGCFVVDDDCRSIFTLLIYLNEDFSGGNTRFFDTLGDGLSKEKTGRSNITPTIGKAIIFNHDLRHEGAMVEKGVKYVMKTEVIFRRKGTQRIPPSINTDSVADKKVNELYEKSDELEKKGDVAGSTAFYLEATDIQIQAASPSVQATPTGPIAVLTRDNLRLIFRIIHLFFPFYILLVSFLPLKCQVMCAQISQYWNVFVKDEVLWSQNFARKFPELYRLQNIMEGEKGGKERAFMKDWYYAFKTSYLFATAKKHSTMCFDLGSFTMKAGRVGDVPYKADNFVAMEAHPHYRSTGNGLMQNWLMGNEVKYAVWPRKVISPIKNSEVADWASLWLLVWHGFHFRKKHITKSDSYLSEMRDTYQNMKMYYNEAANPECHPVLFAEGRHPFDRNYLYHFMFIDFEVPCVCVVPSPVLALYAVGKESGYVIDFGSTETVLTPVWQGKILKELERVYPLGGELLARYFYMLLNNANNYNEIEERFSILAEFLVDPERETEEAERRGEERAKRTFSYSALPARPAIRAAAVYFDPSPLLSPKGLLWGEKKEMMEKMVRESAGYSPIAHFINRSIMECDENMRDYFQKNVILCGGLPNIPGFITKLNVELEKVNPSIKTFAGEDPAFTVIKGAQIYATQPSFLSHCKTRTEYLANLVKDHPGNIDFGGVPEMEATGSATSLIQSIKTIFSNK